MTDHQTTHAPGCWGWGPAHYKCALKEIERNEELLQKALRALKNIRRISSIDSAMNQNPFTLVALLAEIHYIADTALAKEKDNEQ